MGQNQKEYNLAILIEKISVLSTTCICCSLCSAPALRYLHHRQVAIAYWAGIFYPAGLHTDANPTCYSTRCR